LRFGDGRPVAINAARTGVPEGWFV
jgi:hypothetical protein